MQRRSFIKKGILGAIILPVGGAAVLALRRGDYPPPPQSTLTVLDAPSYAVLIAVAKRVIAAPNLDAHDIAQRIDLALSFATKAAQKDFVMALKLLENAFTGLVFRGRTNVFTKMSPDEQDRALEKWRDSRLTVLRGAYHSIRRLCVAAYYSTIPHGKNIGYAGPPFMPPDPGPIVDTAPLSPPYIPKGTAILQEGLPDGAATREEAASADRPTTDGGQR